MLKAQPKDSQFRVVAVNEAFEKISLGEDVKVILTEWPGIGPAFATLKKIYHTECSEFSFAPVLFVHLAKNINQ